jgi:hypothetical protein
MWKSNAVKRLSTSYYSLNILYQIFNLISFLRRKRIARDVFQKRKLSFCWWQIILDRSHSFSRNTHLSVFTHFIETSHYLCHLHMLFLLLFTPMPLRLSVTLPLCLFYFKENENIAMSNVGRNIFFNLWQHFKFYFK